MQNRVVEGEEKRALSALRAPRSFSRLEANLFVCFFHHRAHLPRRHPGRACTAACSTARAAGIVAEVCETGQTSVRMRPVLNIKRSSDEGGVEKTSIAHILYHMITDSKCYKAWLGDRLTLYQQPNGLMPQQMTPSIDHGSLVVSSNLTSTMETVTVYRLPIRLPAKSALTWPVV